ncbi:hypothetical protein NQ317_018350 [Molorchus minor]|uniref:Piwi n=1 Tax=Molorchus minor TaxID=1323400 RepID=A0ABQ9IWQ3_9CUCU|nr:hypothetical protein NQ317_018350 [Molorchus minor]
MMRIVRDISKSTIMEPRGRGRARGRARGAAQQPPAQPVPRPGPAQGAPAPSRLPGQPGAWGRPPQPQQVAQPPPPSAAPTTARPGMQPTPAPSIGRGSRGGGGGDAEPAVVLQGAGEGAETQDRGRGMVVLEDVLIVAKFFAQDHKIWNQRKAGKWGLYQYRVDFSPEIDNTGQRKGLMRTAMQNVLTGYLFDGSVMYTPQRVNPDPLEVFLFNIIIRKCLTFMRLQLVGRDYYDPNTKIAVPEHRLELWPGYYTSMRQHEKNILMNCDVKFKVMRMDNVYYMLLECHGANSRSEFQSKIIGNIVLTYYNNKTYKIDDVDFNTTPQSTFPTGTGNRLVLSSITDRIRQEKLGRECPKTVLLVPELCQLTGLTDRQRENFQLMRALADHTRVGPQQRIQKLMEFSQRMRRNQEVMQELRRWDLTVADSLLKFAGRVLPPETIVGGNQAKYSAGPQADWTRELRALPMFTTGPMQRFAVVCPVKFKSACQEFMQCLQRSARGMSWDIGQPRIFDIPDDRSHTYLDMIENIITKNNPTMIMCVVPNNSQDRYSAIKKKGCVDRGVMSIATKVAIQLNCKIGGAPWTVIMPLSNLMVVGYDVCRDTANKGKSFGAMVASLDKQITRYFNYVSRTSI